jgi:hypothetical protein
MAQALFGLFALGHVMEYCRMARAHGPEKNRRVALVIKASMAIFAAAFLGLGILFLI